MVTETVHACFTLDDDGMTGVLTYTTCSACADEFEYSYSKQFDAALVEGMRRGEGVIMFKEAPGLEYRFQFCTNPTHGG